MAIVTLDQLKEQVGHIPGFVMIDDDMLTRKIAAAQNHIERLLGFRIEVQFGGDDQDPVPPALIEAVCQLAAWWYDQREAAAEGATRSVPFGVSEIVNEYRDFTF